MSFWDEEDRPAPILGKRRDVTKVGVAKALHDDYCGRMYIPEGMAKPNQFIRFAETPEGLAFKIGEKGHYRIRVQNGGTKVMACKLPPCMNKYAPEKAVSVDIEDFEGGYLIRYSQFNK